jgi:tRNA threonylcarbamoyladenosine biosynthesis protein TsaB
MNYYFIAVIISIKGINMKIIGIETATANGSIAVVDENGLLGEYSWSVGSAHSEEIFLSLDKVLRKAKITIKEIDGISVSSGPGSFTGMRIGVTVARSLAQALDKPAVGIPTLDILAHNISGTRYLICPILDALRSEVYTSLYSFNGGKTGEIKRLTDYSIINIEELLGQLLNPKFPRIIFLGPAVRLYREIIETKWPEKAIVASDALLYPQAKIVACLGLKAIKKNKDLKWNKILPLYIRQASTEIHPVKKSMKVVFR